MNKNLAVCFTGHRPSKFGTYDENSELIISIKRSLHFNISNLITSGYTDFISGMALGVDMWAAERVLDLKRIYPDIKLICAIPFEGQEKRWPEESQRRYWNIVNLSDEIHIVCDGEYAPYKMQKRNEWMVDNSSYAISVWDGSSGGTGNCIKYLKKKKVPYTNIDPTKLPM